MELINRNTDYAIRALAHLALTGKQLSTSQLAERESVPIVFLRKIMQQLKTAGIVVSKRGPFGGYVLQDKPENISLYDVIVAVQGPISMNVCFSNPDICENTGSCGVQNLLGTIGQKLVNELENVKLSDVAEYVNTSNKDST